jgi:hypothetical protein
VKPWLAAGLCALSFVACSFQNPNEHLAQRITEAVVNNDLRPVSGDIALPKSVSRVQVAEWSDELNDQGKLQSVHEVTCPPGLEVGLHCFIATFEKRTYDEHMMLNAQGKVSSWQFRAADSGGASAAP